MLKLHELRGRLLKVLLFLVSEAVQMGSAVKYCVGQDK